MPVRSVEVQQLIRLIIQNPEELIRRVEPWPGYYGIAFLKFVKFDDSPLLDLQQSDVRGYVEFPLVERQACITEIGVGSRLPITAASLPAGKIEGGPKFGACARTWRKPAKRIRENGKGASQ